MTEKLRTIKNNKVSVLCMVLTTAYVLSLVLSNTIAGKIWAVAGNMTVSAAVILFPVAYILGDVFTEVYGFKTARTVIWLGFGFNFLAVAVYMIAVLLPHPDYWTSQEAYAVVMGITPRMTAASLVSYLLGEFSNSIILSKLKIRMQGKKLWVRTISSSIIGECFDTAAFEILAFGGVLEPSVLLTLFISEYIFKVSYETLFTPVTYAIVKRLKQIENIDAFDYGEKYNIFQS